MNRMKWRSVGRVAAKALAVVDIALVACVPAMGQEPKPPLPQGLAQESAKSSPPDTTPYVRPVIPEDTMKTPSQTPLPRSSEGASAPVPSPGGRAPEPGPSKEAAPQPGEGPVPQPTPR